ncbi:uncharacterized protein EDB93DRAFT_1167136 [Suillus bovinus]|uniref:uncharacterized protein n=1 Tax=Suillus bovinus TaxID=48563 RepID=UPI001B87DA00|nr:uncharacterized protein EDB93DRAFT_1167136 [Suillus bovinus]KAG2137619.1 hypothetical protein EDB93DRAFT_1167136 [Suillus bovinus]
MASEIKDDNAIEKPIEFLPPLLSKKFNITDVKQDAFKWDKEWEAAIASSTAADVLKEMSCFLDDSVFTPDHVEYLHKILRDFQKVATDILDKLLNDGHFDTIWLLLNAVEQRRHLLEGLKGASNALTLWGQDCRALCPEVTVSNLLSQGGKGFIDFLTRVLETSKSSNIPAFLPNSWWEQASDLPNPWWGQASDVSPPPRQRSRSTKIMFEVATINRNKFIGHFALFSTSSILKDITGRGEGMKNVLHLMENSKGYVARSIAQVKTTLRDKPVIRCENCTKMPEDIGEGVRFMVCSLCKSKLKFEVHYCSQSCQKEHWSVHKKACGKKRVTQGLSGTKGDSLWAFSDSDPVANLIRNLPKDGITLRNIGVNPCKGKRSPAAERQAEMLEADKDAEYFLFTASGERVRFVIDDLGAKMIFRINRGVVLTQPTNTVGVNALGEYMLKLMSKYPGLSRDIILKQLCAEYGDDVAGEIVKLEQDSGKRGAGTFIESWLKDCSSVFGSFSWLNLMV